MAFITTIPEGSAQDKVNEIYQMEKKNNGYLPNYTQAFSLNPEAYAAWKQLIGSVRSRMRMRRYELVTLASAMALDCTY
jgi:hypothetical protein